MSIAIADFIASQTGGFWARELTPPAAPALEVAATSPASVTVDLDGEAGAAHRLYYREVDVAAWTPGVSRAGDGALTQTGLRARAWYEMIAVSTLGGALSLPSSPVTFRAVEDADCILEQVRAALIRRLGELVTAGVASRISRPKRLGLESTYADREIVLAQADGATYDPDNTQGGDGRGLPSAGFLAWHRRFFVTLWRRISQTNTDDIDGLFNPDVARMIDTLTDPTRTWENPLMSVDVEEDVPVQTPGRTCDGRMLTLHVMFEHRDGDSASQS